MIINGKYYIDWDEVMELLSEVLAVSRDGQQRYKDFDEITNICAQFIADQYKKSMELPGYHKD